MQTTTKEPRPDSRAISCSLLSFCSRRFSSLSFSFGYGNPKPFFYYFYYYYYYYFKNFPIGSEVTRELSSNITVKCLRKSFNHYVQYQALLVNYTNIWSMITISLHSLHSFIKKWQNFYTGHKPSSFSSNLWPPFANKIYVEHSFIINYRLY